MYEMGWHVALLVESGCSGRLERGKRLVGSENDVQGAPRDVHAQRMEV